MNFDRVIGLRMLYAVIARKEYANISSAVAASPSRSVTSLPTRRLRRDVMWRLSRGPGVILCAGMPRGYMIQV